MRRCNTLPLPFIRRKPIGEEKTQTKIKCFLLGGGQSLAGFDFSRLDSDITIGINIIFKFYEPRILIWSDADIYPKYKEEIDELRAMKYASQDVVNPTYKDVIPYKVSQQFYGEVGLEKGLFGGKGAYFTGILAISLAISLGYSPIYLLGYDGGEVNGRFHFHDIYKKHASNEAYTKGIKNFDVFKDYEIYNCSLKSKITQFPKVNIAEVL